MKKLITLILTICIGSYLFAYGTDDDEFTWADYEMLCYKYNVEPTWEQYEYLVNNPQCILTEEGDMNG